MTTTVAMVSSAQVNPPLGSETTISFLAPEVLPFPLGAGRLLPGIKAKVLKANGRLAQPGERGELFVKGPSRALRYYENRDA